MKGAHQFVVYVDEAGDEGFKFSCGSSEWFVLSAVVVRARIEPETVKLVDAARAQFNMVPGTPLHFTKLSHPRRVAFVQRIAAASENLSVMSVAVHKPTAQASGLSMHPRLYFYSTRLLMERVSWFCRDTGGAECRASVVFSGRAGTPYTELVDYLKRLHADELCRIHWPAMSLDAIEVRAHRDLRGLQIADAVCSSLYAAIEPDDYGNTEDRYVRILAPAVYRRGGNCRSYGMKFMPGVPAGMEAEVRFVWYREVYNN